MHFFQSLTKKTRNSYQYYKIHLLKYSTISDLETRNPESYFTAEMALDNPSTSDEYQDADQDFRDNDATTAGDRGVIPVEPIDAPSQYAKRTDIYMETGFEPATLSWPPTTRSDEDSSPDRPNRQPTIKSAKSPTFDENSASSRYTYTNSQEITVIGRRESEYSFRHSKGPIRSLLSPSPEIQSF